MGLGGMAFALLACLDVTLTDKAELLPLLQKNVNANLSPSSLSGPPPIQLLMRSKSLRNQI